MQDKLDLSRLERLTPRADSWDTVCSRIDAESRIIPFRILSAIPLAASLVLVGLSVFMSAFSSTSENISINSITSTEIVNWIDNLGTGESDGFDTLDENVTLSYFYKESK